VTSGSFRKGLGNTKWCFSNAFSVDIFSQTHQQDFHSILNGSCNCFFLTTLFITAQSDSIFELRDQTILTQMPHSKTTQISTPQAKYITQHTLFCSFSFRDMLPIYRIYICAKKEREIVGGSISQ